MEKKILMQVLPKPPPTTATKPLPPAKPLLPKPLPTPPTAHPFTTIPTLPTNTPPQQQLPSTPTTSSTQIYNSPKTIPVQRTTEYHHRKRQQHQKEPETGGSQTSSHPTTPSLPSQPYLPTHLNNHSLPHPSPYPPRFTTVQQLYTSHARPITATEKGSSRRNLKLVVQKRKYTRKACFNTCNHCKLPKTKDFGYSRHIGVHSVDTFCPAVEEKEKVPKRHG